MGTYDTIKFKLFDELVSNWNQKIIYCNKKSYIEVIHLWMKYNFDTSTLHEWRMRKEAWFLTMAKVVGKTRR